MILTFTFDLFCLEPVVDYHYIRISIFIYYKQECQIFYGGLSYIFSNPVITEIICRYLLFSNHNWLSHLSHIYNWIHPFDTSISQITKSPEDPVTKYQLGCFLNTKPILYLSVDAAKAWKNPFDGWQIIFHLSSSQILKFKIHFIQQYYY